MGDEINNEHDFDYKSILSNKKNFIEFVRSFVKKRLGRYKSKYRRRIGIRRSILIVAVLLIIVFSSIPFISMDKFINIHIGHMDLCEAKDFGLTSEKVVPTL